MVPLPTKPMPPCRHPGCPEVQVPGGHGYCGTHVREYRRWDMERRGSARQRGYTKQYEKARTWVLRRQPLCPLCLAEGRLTPATQTHHIVPLSDGGTNSVRNLMPLCEAHHAEQHRKRH